MIERDRTERWMDKHLSMTTDLNMKRCLIQTINIETVSKR